MSATLELTEPAYGHVPPAYYTHGDQVADLAAQANFGPDGEQELALNAIFAVGEHAKSVAFETWIIACRQNLKTGIFKQCVLGWLYLFKADPVIWSAHEWDTVAESFHDLDELIGGWAYLSRQVRYIHRGERDQEIGLRNGARLLCKTRTPGGGKGLAGAKSVMDEAWKVSPAHMGALLPTLSGRSVTGDPQIVFGSSAAYEFSSVMHAAVERGRRAATDPAWAVREGRFAYLEWCADAPEIACRRGVKCDHALDTPGCGCDDPRQWAKANPALGRRISYEYVAGERRAMPPAEFGRERMGWHDKPVGQAHVIPIVDWAAGLDAGSEPAAHIALAVVYSSDKKRAAIGLAGKRRDGRWHVELADLLSRTSLVVARVSGIVTSRAATEHPVCAIVIDPHGYEGACIRPLEEAGLGPLIVKPTATDVTAAWSSFYEGVTDAHTICHRGQDELTLAVLGGSTRPVGDAGEAWARRKSGIDIAPAVAVTEARWGHELRAPDYEATPGAWAI